MTPVIETKNLWKAYRDQEVLRALNLRVLPGETLLLLGPNGSGKSTLLACLSGMLRPDSGEISLLGENPIGGLRSARTRAVLARVGVSIQAASLLYPSLTIRENLSLYASLYEPSRETRDVDEVLSEWGLEEARDKREQELSGGMLQRAKLARALVTNPEVLLLDEPTAFLDDAGTELVLSVLQRFSEQTVVVASHNMQLANALAGSKTLTMGTSA